MWTKSRAFHLVLLKKTLHTFRVFSITKLPIIAKGVLRGDDALKAVEAGCAAILVSNHGARQLDGVPATVDITYHNNSRCA